MPTNPGPPDCHPDRPHHAKGMCEQCYMRAYDAARRDRRNAARRAANRATPKVRRRPGLPARIPDCHPDRKHCGRGLCGPCYQQARRAGTFVVGMATCHPDRPELARGFCHQCYAKRRYWGDPERYRAAARERGRAQREQLRDELVRAYGGRCACENCPETNPAFLTLDHVNGDGKTHRLELGSHTYADLRRRGWPRDGYRLLCWNCNAMVRFGGTCPHEDQPME